MAKFHFNIKLVNHLLEIITRINHGESLDKILKDCGESIRQISAQDILPIVYEIKESKEGITATDIKKLFQIFYEVHDYPISELHVPESTHPGHPLQILKEENQQLQSTLNQTTNIIETLDNSEGEMIERLKHQMALLGQFYNHYNRKEKLIFPILERYGYYTMCRIMWGNDDRIRNFYKGTKTMIERLPSLEFHYVKKSYALFAQQFTEMLSDEETFLFPIITAVFSEDDWLAIAEESDAFGYSLIKPKDNWLSERKYSIKGEKAKDCKSESEHFSFGGGYLTLKEADVILNNLPLEITFVDRHDIFKYFNDRIAASDMMFIRTPTSIGRNVANCHPPKSLKKVMQLIRDLKTKRRAQETMWFKKKNQFIHITYKGVFDEDGKYVGILEYVQDIQPFFELPKEVKRELSNLE